jgi:hypothetical protein
MSRLLGRQAFHNYGFRSSPGVILWQQAAAPASLIRGDEGANVNAFNVFGQNGNAGLVGFSKGATDIVPSGGLASILSPLADTAAHANPPTGSPASTWPPTPPAPPRPVSSVDQRGQPRNKTAWA